MRLFAVLMSLCLFVTSSISPVFAANAPGDAADKAEAGAKQKLSVAHIELTGGYSEGVTAPGLFGDVVETLGTALQRFDKAARDDSLDAVILHISDPSIGWAKLNELRVGIQKMRAKGRKVYAWMESADTKGYLIAAACDQIVLPDSGMLMLPGLRAEEQPHRRHDVVARGGQRCDDQPEEKRDRISLISETAEPAQTAPPKRSGFVDQLFQGRHRLRF